MTTFSPIKLLNVAYIAKRWDPEQKRWPSKAPHGLGGQWMALDQVAVILSAPGPDGAPSPTRVDLGFMVADAPHIDGLEVRKIPVVEDGRPEHERGLRYGIKLKAGKVRATVYVDDWNPNKGDFGKKLDALKKMLGNLDEGQMPGEAVEGSFMLKVAGKHKQFREALNAEANREAQGAGAEDRMPPEVAKWPLFPVEQAKTGDTLYIHQPEIGIVHERFKLAKEPQAVMIGGEPFARLYRENGPPFVVPTDRGVLIKPPDKVAEERLQARIKMLKAAAKILDRQPEGAAFTGRIIADGPHVRFTKKQGVWTGENPWRTDKLVERLEDAGDLVTVIEYLQRQERQREAAVDWRVGMPDQIRAGDRIRSVDGVIFVVKMIEEPHDGEFRMLLAHANNPKDVVEWDVKADEIIEEWIPEDEAFGVGDGDNAALGARGVIPVPEDGKWEHVRLDEVEHGDLIAWQGDVFRVDGIAIGAGFRNFVLQRADNGEKEDLQLDNEVNVDVLREANVAEGGGADIRAASILPGDEILLDDMWMKVLGATGRLAPDGWIDIKYELPNGVIRSFQAENDRQIRVRRNPDPFADGEVEVAGQGMVRVGEDLLRRPGGAKIDARHVKVGDQLGLADQWLRIEIKETMMDGRIMLQLEGGMQQVYDPRDTVDARIIDVPEGAQPKPRPAGSGRDMMKLRLGADLGDFPVQRITKRPGGGLNAYFEDNTDAINAAEHLRGLGYEAEVRAGGRVAVKKGPADEAANLEEQLRVAGGIANVPPAQAGVVQPPVAAPAGRRGRKPVSGRKALGERARGIVGANVKAVRKRPNGGVIMRLQISDRAAVLEAKGQLEAAGLRVRQDYDAKRERILIIYPPPGEAVNGPNEPKGPTARLLGKVGNVRRLGGGINETKKGTLESTGETVVIKTASGLHRMGGGRDLDRERAAYLLAEELQADGFDIVVPQVEINDGNVEGVRGKALVYEFIRGKTGDGAGGGKDNYTGGHELYIFDYMINNTDRHGGNWMVRDEDNHIVAIDNGLTFWSNDRHAPDKRRALDHMNEERGAALEKFYARREAIEAKVGHLTPDEWKDFWKRVGMIADKEAAANEAREAKAEAVKAAKAAIARRQARLDKALEDQRKLNEIDLNAHFGAAEAARMRRKLEDAVAKHRKTIKEGEDQLRRAEAR